MSSISNEGVNPSPQFTVPTEDEFDHLDVFERERILNKLAFALLGRLRILDRAGLDRRLGYGHRYIVYSLARAADIAEGGIAELDRDQLCADLGITKKTLRNKLADLYAWGYIHQKFLPSGGVSDTVAFGNGAVQREELQAQYVSAISEFCASKRFEPSRNVGTVANGTVPESRATVPTSRASVPESRDGPSKSVPESRASVPENGDASRTPTRAHELCEEVRYNNNPPTPPQPEAAADSAAPSAEQTSPVGVQGKPRKKKTAARDRGTRLAEDWRLPKSWGEWALENFEVSADQVRRTADDFRDHWHAASGAKAVKLDWAATWRKWCRSSYQGWKPRAGAKSETAPDLLDLAEPKPMTDLEILLAAEAAMEG